MTTLVTLLVGAHFHSPAKVLLEHLPTGTTLMLVPETDNPYDESGLAVGVWVAPSAFPASQYEALREVLPGSGYDLDELLAAGEPLQLGHIAKTGNKPLQGTDYVGTEEWAAAGTPTSGTLQFDPQGRALVSAEAHEAIIMSDVEENELAGIAQGLDRHGSGENS